MNHTIYKWAVAMIVVCILVSGCGKKNRQPTATDSPNASLTYDRGRDFVGVIKKIDTQNKTISFYNIAFEEESVCTYSGGTEILTKNGKQISSESLEIGQVLDVYQNPETKKLSKLQLSADILEYDRVTGLAADPDAGNLEVNGVKYRYGSGFTAFSDGEPIHVQEISPTDEVTFRGVKGKAYSIVVTKGHGYLKPKKYTDFIGGTMTVGGVAILPVTEKMLVPVPEGTYEVTMKNGDYAGSSTVTIERNKQFKLDMSKFKTLAPHTGQVVFDIDPVGAELYVNGSLTDYSKPVSLKYGKHSLRVILEGYTPYIGIIDVQSASPTVRISLTDENTDVTDDTDDTTVSRQDSENDQNVSDQYDNQHTITVSAPIGASVYMDGTYKGVAPCSFPKKIGTVTITLSMSGLQTKSYTMKTVNDNKDIAWSFPDLENYAVG